jgi:predicted nucleotide-binding protein
MTLEATKLYELVDRLRRATFKAFAPACGDLFELIDSLGAGNSVYHRLQEEHNARWSSWAPTGRDDWQMPRAKEDRESLAYHLFRAVAELDDSGSALLLLRMYHTTRQWTRPQLTSRWPANVDALRADFLDYLVDALGRILAAVPKPPVPDLKQSTQELPTAPATTPIFIQGCNMQPSRKKVFIIHGRNITARDQLGIFLRSLGLQPVNFMDLRASMGGTPTVAEIVEKGMSEAQGVIALVTADEYAAVRPDLRYPHDAPNDVARWQARPNVIFEAGMAFGRDRTRVVFVLLGDPQLFTDVAGILVLRPRNDPAGDRATLRLTLLTGMNCDVEPHSTDWMKSGDFETCTAPLPGVSARDPFQ